MVDVCKFHTFWRDSSLDMTLRVSVALDNDVASTIAFLEFSHLQQ